MANKFDTNQLDPDFPQKIEEAKTATLPKNTYQTTEFPSAIDTERQTMRFGDADFQAYQTPPLNQNMGNYQATPLYSEPFENTATRKIAKIGLPENIMVALPYLPWGIGWVAGLIELLIVPKSETKVRFHAAQGFAVHIGFFVISATLSVLDNAFDWLSVGNGIFQLVMFIMFIVWSLKAYKGKPIHIEAVDDLTNWIEEKIDTNHKFK